MGYKRNKLDCNVYNGWLLPSFAEKDLIDLNSYSVQSLYCNHFLEKLINKYLNVRSFDKVAKDCSNKFLGKSRRVLLTFLLKMCH